jgi:hypothetical protein
MRLLLLFASVILGVLIICLVFVRRVGADDTSASQAALAVLRPGVCVRPCWNGIIPGTTLLERAEILLNADKTVTVSQAMESTYAARQICWSLRSWLGCAFRSGYAGLFGPVILVELNPPSGSFKLGDAVLLFGRPEAGTLCVRSITRSRAYMSASVYFRGGLEIRAYHPLQPSAPRFDPDMVVYAVRYNVVSEDPPYRFDAPAWHGFGGYAGQHGC